MGFTNNTETPEQKASRLAMGLYRHCKANDLPTIIGFGRAPTQEELGQQEDAQYYYEIHGAGTVKQSATIIDGIVRGRPEIAIELARRHLL